MNYSVKSTTKTDKDQRKKSKMNMNNETFSSNESSKSSLSPIETYDNTIMFSNDKPTTTDPFSNEVEHPKNQSN